MKAIIDDGIRKACKISGADTFIQQEFGILLLVLAILRIIRLVTDFDFPSVQISPAVQVSIKGCCKADEESVFATAVFL